MSTLVIFIVGVFVSGLTLAAALFVGLQEAADPTLSRLEDLTETEKKVVGR